MAIAALALLGVVGVVFVVSSQTAAPLANYYQDSDVADFNEWMFQEEKEYSSDEYAYRF